MRIGSLQGCSWNEGAVVKGAEVKDTTKTTAVIYMLVKGDVKVSLLPSFGVARQTRQPATPAITSVINALFACSHCTGHKND